MNGGERSKELVKVRSHTRLLQSKSAWNTSGQPRKWCSLEYITGRLVVSGAKLSDCQSPLFCAIVLVQTLIIFIFSKSSHFQSSIFGPIWTSHPGRFVLAFNERLMNPHSQVVKCWVKQKGPLNQTWDKKWQKTEKNNICTFQIAELKLGEGWRWLCRSGWRVKNKQTKARGINKQNRERRVREAGQHQMSLARIWPWSGLGSRHQWSSDSWLKSGAMHLRWVLPACCCHQLGDKVGPAWWLKPTRNDFKVI